MKLLVGLGNPGRQYAETRHNVGWMVLDAMAGQLGVRFRSSWRRPVLLAKGSLEGVGAITMVKPTTFMNRSGDVLPALMRPAGVKPEDMIVVVDDISLPLGKLRIRAGGSAGGHNGLRSIIDRLGTEKFMRIRIGIGSKQEGQSLTEHVLGRMNRAEREEVQAAADRAVEAVACIWKEGVENAMNRFN